MRSVAGQGTPAIAVLRRAGVPHTLHTYENTSRAYGEEAVTALGQDGHRVFKTLVVTVDGALHVAVLPVAGTLDLKALAAAVGGRRAVMADPAAAERATGYVRGGISPLGQRRRLPTVVDSGALDQPTVFVSAGRRGLEVELGPADLVRLTAATVARIAGPPPR
jgi:Cys-tRNA(Pro)/Cys-tRNA(Cys) deacylase